MTLKTKLTLENLRNHSIKGQLPEALGIEIEAVTEDSITASLVVDERHLRPGKIMNGGVSLMLIETVGSFSSYIRLDPEKQNAFGIQVSANHLSIARPGDKLFATSAPVHIGRTTQVWDVTITNQKQKLISSGRITMLVTEALREK